jgi:epoxyqueuosine reductase QueG
MEEEAFLLWSEGSPMRRSGIARLARNAAVVLGNVGTRVHLPVLAGGQPRPPERRRP